MANETPSSPIFAAWTDHKGVGPDVLVLSLENFPQPDVAAILSRPDLHRALHIVIAADPDESYVTDVAPMVGGAFSLHVEAATEMHRQMSAWLGAPAASPYADALAEIERLRDVVRDAAALLEAKSDRGARLEWAKTIRARGERP